MKKAKRKVTRRKNKDKEESLRHEMAQKHQKRTESEAKLYRLGFWIFFFILIFGVGFSMWAISSIYKNYVDVTEMLDESFERTNLVLDVTSSKVTLCEQQLDECQTALEKARGGVP
jgi:heme/copper-type cytochrome/quinol oxidase subunit 3